MCAYVFERFGIHSFQVKAVIYDHTCVCGLLEVCGMVGILNHGNNIYISVIYVYIPQTDIYEFE